jgi:hypothetical protein
VDVAVSRRMGLFVVARLAARHGIRVRLRPAASGGLTALVWLPDEAVTHDGDGTPGMRRPGMEAPAPQQALSASPSGSFSSGGFATAGPAPAGSVAGVFSTGEWGANERSSAEEAVTAARTPRFRPDAEDGAEDGGPGQRPDGENGTGLPFRTTPQPADQTTSPAYGAGPASPSGIPPELSMGNGTDAYGAAPDMFSSAGSGAYTQEPPARPAPDPGTFAPAADAFTGGSGADSYSPGADTYSPGADTYAGGGSTGSFAVPDAYGSGNADTFVPGHAGGPAGPGSDTFPPAADTFAASGDAYAASGDTFAASGDTFAASGDTYGASGDTYGANGDTYAANGDTRGPGGQQPVLGAPLAGSTRDEHPAPVADNGLSSRGWSPGSSAQGAAPATPPGSSVVVPPPASLGEEHRLPIFESVESDWFRRGRHAVAGAAAGPEQEAEEAAAPKTWTSPSDEGWRAAQVAAAPSSGGLTPAGLPKRVPKANLVPGAAAGSDAPPAAPAPVRSAAATRDRFSDFQRGVKKGRAIRRGADAPDGADDGDT